MTPDIRAALREAADILSEPIMLAILAPHVDPHGLADRLRAIADAPPTVAELLPRVDATHSVWWLSSSGEKRAKLHGSTIVFEWRKPHPWLEPWQPSELERSDMICIATLVEVTP